MVHIAAATVCALLPQPRLQCWPLVPVSSLPPRPQLAGEGLELLPGVLPLLEALAARDDVAVGLVTGNLEPIGWGACHAAGWCAGGGAAAARPPLPSCRAGRGGGSVCAAVS